MILTAFYRLTDLAYVKAEQIRIRFHWKKALLIADDLKRRVS
jgi:hypothetical protein